jgi:hypothetical protein
MNPIQGSVPDEPYDTDGAHSGYLPIRDDNLAETNRYGDYKAAFLQRLANPLLPWHATLNPYITVDWQSIDLTVFNGEDYEHPTSDGDPWDRDDPNNANQDPGTTPRTPTDPPFASRERTGQRTQNVNYGLYNTATLAFSTVGAEDDPRGTDYFSLNARHSLGYLSRQIDWDGTPPTAGHPNKNPVNMMTVDDFDDFVTNAQHASAVGDPYLPFEWVTWNDRPYVSHLELMHVPASSPSRLTFEAVHRHPSAGGANDDPYLAHDVAASPSDPTILPYRSYRASFGHLLNFFNTTSKNPTSATTHGANYYRIFDFVEVPSRFAGTEKWFNPTQIRSASSPNAGWNDVPWYRPPFNSLSRFRDPGRVNLNTIWDHRIWQAISEGYPQMDIPAFWDTTIQSTTTFSGGVTVPTAIPNPFRAAGSAMLAPPLPQGVMDPHGPLRHDAVEATLLRSENPAAPPARQPLFDARNYSDVTTPAPDNLAVHPRPNAYFRYQGLQRLGNLVSTHSNVFAVWVTVGYFEVTPSPAGQEAEHPDGFLLGPEIGSETGELVRHRAFYLIDRSIPVAFQPGVNHNIEKTILLRRFIE